MKSLFVLALLLCFSVASALKCYECNSETSMSNCESSKKEKECNAERRCGEMSAEYKKDSNEIKTYKKGCAAENCDFYSKTFDACKENKGATCNLKCCSGDLCNGGTASVVSVFLMVAGALVALFR